jgi:hypothetical protein
MGSRFPHFHIPLKPGASFLLMSSIQVFRPTRASRGPYSNILSLLVVVELITGAGDLQKPLDSNIDSAEFSVCYDDIKAMR